MVPGANTSPLSEAVIGPVPASAAIAAPSSVLVPAPSAAVVAMRTSPEATSELAMLVRFLSSAAGEIAVPPVPGADHAVDFTMSICTGTPAAKKVVETAAENLISLMMQSRVASVQRNWNISLFAASAAGRMPVKPP